MVAANYVAYTAPINPPGATPILTISHLWPGLQRKIHYAQEFVPDTLEATDVISTSTTPDTGLPVTVREVVFREGKRVGDRRIRESCVEYYPMKVEFIQPNGSKVMNIVSQGGGGEDDLYMTYTFEHLHPEAEGDPEKLAQALVREKNIAKISVESTIRFMREMVADGRL